MLPAARMPHDGLSADNADSTLQIVKEQQPFLRIAHARLRLAVKAWRERSSAEVGGG